MSGKREVIGEQFSLKIDPYPAAGEACPKCGADAENYIKHPALQGGRCNSCDGIWLPGLAVTETKPIYRDQISVEPTDDGGATIRFNDGE
jgi:hypothetical protein